MRFASCTAPARASRFVPTTTRRALGLLADEIPAASRDGERIALPPMSPDALARINRQLVERGIGVHELARSERDLESIFMELVA